jgi:hypothetical protein
MGIITEITTKVPPINLNELLYDQNLNTGFVLEVDLTFSQELHEIFNDLPFTPSK